MADSARVAVSSRGLASATAVGSRTPPAPDTETTLGVVAGVVAEGGGVAIKTGAEVGIAADATDAPTEGEEDAAGGDAADVLPKVNS